jgi:L-histidine N-alpha-methyltransferase
LSAIDFHSSVSAKALQRQAIASLRANRIDPKFLYVTSRQAELWREVARRHAPIQSNPEFVRIYRQAFNRIAGQLPAEKIHLVGLGCGTGMKELDLFVALKTKGRACVFSAIDVSADLVQESIHKLTAAGAEDGGGLVCDLAETAFLAQWLSDRTGDGPRLLTFFGLAPNFAPDAVAQLFHSILRPADILLVSVHLAPIDAEVDLPDAMESVLPQYDNVETRAWLAAALAAWNLQDRVDAPVFEIGQVEGIHDLVSTARL